MTIIPLCREDPLTGLVHDLFNANIVRIPDARVVPLTVLLHHHKRTYFRGSLLPMLEDARPLGLPIEESLLTDISGRRSRKVNLDLGLHILRGFLRGFGLPYADLEAGFAGAAHLTFAFPEARRRAVDPNALGWALTERRIDRQNPAASILFNESGYELLLIDSILISRQISIVLSSARGRRLNVDMSVLRETMTELGGSVGANSDSDLELTLQSQAELTFAFTCVRVIFSSEGEIIALPPDPQQRTLSLAEPQPHVVLSHGPGLLIWDHTLP
ncbi:hypothetical protein [Candidatus Chloroploca sp. Khr17]|uniref:gasdermin n=1 Tax=Candidatus Chloroploca sp. Khr17 TaxID=2496869 RepID=UPI00101BADEA|nr:hypothetical protein [Candidatus Chloroploca sp. Khr17]